MGTDFVSIIVGITEFTAALFVIGFGLLFLYVGIAAAAKAWRDQKGPATSRPSARRTLAEQLKSPSPRVFCHVNHEEVRRLYPQAVGKPIPKSSTVQSASVQSKTVGADFQVAKGTMEESRSVEKGAVFEPPSEYEIASDLMKALVTQNRVWFGLGVETPDQATLDRLNEHLRGLGEVGASDVVDSKKVQDHRKRLQSGPSIALDARVKEIDEARKKYSFVALKSRFTCVCDGAIQSASLTPDSTQPATAIGFELSGVEVRVDLPASKVQPEVEGMFRHSRSLDDLMVFGTIVDWSPNTGGSPVLRISPLVASLSWTET